MSASEFAEGHHFGPLCIADVGWSQKCDLLVRESFEKLYHGYLLDEVEEASVGVRLSSE